MLFSTKFFTSKFDHVFSYNASKKETRFEDLIEEMNSITFKFIFILANFILFIYFFYT